jgi:hypothetical protein
MDDILDEGIFDNKEENILDKKQFKFYKDFQNLEEAKAFIDLLKANNIDYLASKPEVIIDEAIVGTRLMPKVVVKIRPYDFLTVNKLIETEIGNLEYTDLQDHYLNQLADAELHEILTRPDEWSVEDVNIAKILLRGRGVDISDEEVQRLREERLQEIRAGKTGNKAVMALYFLGIIIGFFTSFIFILAGIGMGYYYAFSKSVDLDGRKHFVFEPTTRKYGQFILFGGAAVLVVEVITLFIIG